MAEPLQPLLAARVREALAAAFGADVEAPEPLVLPARDPRHGDYSISAPMALARTLKQAPAALAEQLAAQLHVDDLCEPPEVVPPGFVNLRLRPQWLAERVGASLGDERVAVPTVPDAARVVVDYSAPNIAKDMHVGHLRSTIIGDCLSNVHELVGHDVERVNHIGDWGTQFGLLIAHLEDEQPEVLTGDADVAVSDVVVQYQAANRRFESDDGFRDRARNRVVELQSGEPAARAAWQRLVDVSRRENTAVYALLSIDGLIERGESFYQPMLGDVVADLEAKGLVVVDDGAKCVFVPGFTNKDGDPLPLIVQKADGGYNYATTDLAAVRHRVGDGATCVLYVVAADQAQHLSMVFTVARMAGWVPDGVELVHVPFGLVLGEDGKRLRTRSGSSTRLRDLLDEAVARARDFVLERAAERGEEPPDDVDEIARVVGIGAVKYADLSQNRQSNYVFSYDKMLSLKGNTAPYLQYAYARIRSILRDASPPPDVSLVLGEPQEVDLAKRLVELPDVIDRVVAESAPNHLCAYLYELSQAYNQFYEHCPVLRADEPARASRLALCEITASTLRLGLSLLGIEVLERL